MPSWSCLWRKPVVSGDRPFWSRKSAQAPPKVPVGSDRDKAKFTIVGTVCVPDIASFNDSKAEWSEANNAAPVKIDLNESLTVQSA